MWSQRFPHPQNLFAWYFFVCYMPRRTSKRRKWKGKGAFFPSSLNVCIVQDVAQITQVNSRHFSASVVLSWVRTKAQTHTHSLALTHTLHTPPWVQVQSYKSYNGLPHLTVRRPGESADSTPAPSRDADADTFAVRPSVRPSVCPFVRRRAFEYKINIQYMPMWVCILFLAYIISGIEK